MLFSNSVLLSFIFVTGSAFAAGKPSHKTDPTKVLSEIVWILERGSCGMGSCGSRLNDVTCWSNGRKGGNVRCTYRSDAGDLKLVTGANAEKLKAAMENLRQIETRCGAGTCGFRDHQDVQCGGPNEGQTRSITCTVSRRVAPSGGVKKHRRSSGGATK